MKEKNEVVVTGKLLHIEQTEKDTILTIKTFGALIPIRVPRVPELTGVRTLTKEHDVKVVAKIMIMNEDKIETGSGTFTPMFMQAISVEQNI